MSGGYITLWESIRLDHERRCMRHNANGWVHLMLGNIEYACGSFAKGKKAFDKAIAVSQRRSFWDFDD